VSSTLIAEHRRPGRARRALGAPQAAGVAGILCALLLVASIATIRSGLAGPPTIGLLTHGSTTIDDGRVEFGLSLFPYVAITFIWFMAVVRSQFASPTNDMFGTVFLATGVLFLGSLLVAAALGLSVMDLRSASPPAAGGALWLGGGAVYDLLFLIAPRMAGAFVLITANLLHRVNLMPRWLTAVSLAVGIVLLFITRRIDWIVFVLPVWMIAVSVLILLRLGRVTED
jgi:hypothetical protein